MNIQTLVSEELMNLVIRYQEILGVKLNPLCNHQQENYEFHIYYYIIVCNNKPAKAATCDSLSHKGLIIIVTEVCLTAQQVS